MRSLLYTLLFLLAGPPLLTACSDETEVPRGNVDLQPLIARTEATYSNSALAYVRAAFDTMRTNHVYGPDYDWEELWLATLESAEGASSIEEARSAIRFAVADLDDPHAAFGVYPDSLRAGDVDSSAFEGHVEMPAMASRLIDGGIGYVEIPRFAWPTGELADAYATNLQDLIGRLETQDVCGWMVDLRRNSGGNMWPMLAGAGPLLGNGEIGAFVDRNADSRPWIYRDGTASLDTISVSVRREPVHVEGAPPVAVLTSDRTGNSAEAVVVAFRGRPSTRSFGRATGGATTSPAYVDFPDGSWLRFSEYFFADRLGTVYDGPIEPDVYVETEMWEDHAVAESTAVAWLRGAGACR